ncbi:MAG: hypothetical protein JWR72_1284 [Flavisolibacter sp.]|jgi:hypothetical protein|nr:hypothetical protein [Flavisolibacter sp.]
MFWFGILLPIFKHQLRLMKNLIFAFFLFPLASFAQDTCGLKKSKDPFTNVTKLSTGFKNFNGNGVTLSISADATPAEIDFFLWIKDNGKCFDPESTAQIIWEGERSRTSFKNSGSMNCEGAFHFVFKNTPNTASWLKKLATKKVATIKLTNAKIETLITLSEEQKVLFQKMASCIANEGKSLRP